MLFGVLRDEGLTATAPKWKCAWAAATAFNFLLNSNNESPWNTYFGPMVSTSGSDGKVNHAPDIAELDAEVIALWQDLFYRAKHPAIRARYADLVWDFCRKVTAERPDHRYVQGAIEAYLQAVSFRLYKNSIDAVDAVSRMIELALRIKDEERIEASKRCGFELFQEHAKAQHVGVWAQLFDLLIANKNIKLSENERGELFASLERILAECSAPDSDSFDPWSAKAAAVRLAENYQRTPNMEQAHRAIRTWGVAFELKATEAEPFLAMTWLQEVHDEYHRRGMKDDATRVQLSIAEKSKNLSQGMKDGQVAFEVPNDEMKAFLDTMTSGSTREALARITSSFIPRVGEVRSLLEELVTATPFFALVPIVQVADDHFATQTGGIESDSDGRLMLQLAQNIEIHGLFLSESLSQLRVRHQLTVETIMSFLDESPVFCLDRRLLLKQGIQAYLEGDCTKAIHVIIPQIEQALRTLLRLVGGSWLRPGKNLGTLQFKTLNEILRETAIRNCLGENLTLYLLNFLADQRGQNLRNVVCHGLAADHQFNQRLCDRTLHALLSVALIRRSIVSG